MKYRTTWRNKWLTSNAKNISDMISALKEAVKTLEEMEADGIVLLDEADDDDYAELGTNDPSIATKHGLNLKR